MRDAVAVPPAERYSLPGDLAAWWAAIRGLRDNPLLAQLRLLERRRAARVPRWRRATPLWLGLIAAIATLLYMLVPVLRQFSGTYITPFPLLLYSGGAFAVVAYASWLLAGIYHAALTVVGLLARRYARSRGAVLDDAVALTSLTDREIATAFLALLWPPLVMRSVVGLQLLAATPLCSYISHLLSDLAQMSVSHDFFSNLAWEQDLLDALWQTAAMLGLGCIVLLLSSGAALAMLLWYMALSRGMNFEKLGTLSAAAITLAQISGPFLLMQTSYYAAYLPYVDYDCFPGSTILVATLVYVVVPVYSALLLGLARRLPWLRAVLLVFSPVVMFILCFSAVQIMCLQYVYEMENATDLALSMPGYALLGVPGLLAVGMDSLPDYTWIMCQAFLLLLPAQALYIYIASRFALEAVGARRRRGD